MFDGICSPPVLSSSFPYSLSSLPGGGATPVSESMSAFGLSAEASMGAFKNASANMKSMHFAQK